MFYHPDLNLQNLFVHLGSKISGTKARLAAITGWRNAAFLPRYWVATNIHVRLSFVARAEDDTIADWDEILRNVVVKLGFSQHLTWFKNTVSKPKD